MSGPAFQQRIDRISELVASLEETADPAVRAASKQLAAAVMELHGAGLERVMELVSHCGASSSGLMESFTRDPLLNSLLILHNVHPVDFETRVRRAVEGAGGEVIEVQGSAIRVAVPAKREAAAREALEAAAPDVAEIHIENSTSGFVPLTAIYDNKSEAAP